MSGVGNILRVIGVDCFCFPPPQKLLYSAANITDIRVHMVTSLMNSKLPVPESDVAVLARRGEQEGSKLESGLESCFDVSRAVEQFLWWWETKAINTNNT